MVDELHRPVGDARELGSHGLFGAIEDLLADRLEQARALLGVQLGQPARADV